LDALPAEILSVALDHLGREFHPSYAAYLASTPGCDPVALNGADSLKSLNATDGMILYVIGQKGRRSSRTPPIVAGAHHPRLTTPQGHAPKKLPTLGAIAPARDPKRPGARIQPLPPVCSAAPIFPALHGRPDSRSDLNGSSSLDHLVRAFSDFDFSRRTPTGGGIGTESGTGLQFFLKPVALPADSPSHLFRQEVGRFSQYEHGTILHVNSFCESPPTLVCEYWRYGSLQDVFDEERNGNVASGWCNTAKQIVLFGIAEGMSWLHSKRVIHGNLNPANVILDDNMRPLIGDCGLTREFHRNIGFMAPELLSHEKYKSKIDVWSYGMIVYQIVMGIPPFDPWTPFDMVKEAVLKGELPEVTGKLPAGFKVLIANCVARDPSCRPTFDAILSSYLQGNCVLQDVDMDEYRSYQRLVHPATPEESRIEQLRENAENSRVDAQLEIARCYLRGVGVPVNLKEASRYLSLAADLGSSEAQFAYGLLLHRYKRDGARTIRYLKIAADQGYVNAQILLYKVLPDPPEREQYLEMAVRAGNVTALLIRGTNLQKTDPQAAVHFLKLAAHKGSRSAQLKYAIAVHTGLGGVAVDVAEANRYYRWAADQGDAKAACNLAYNLQRGDGCERNIDSANKLYKMAADSGYANAQSNYAYNLMNGIGIGKDPVEAMKLYKLAADQGHLVAMCNYGANLMTGDGCNRDVAKGLEMLRAAADTGHAPAQLQMGTFLLGHPGVPPNLREAAKYYKLAADQGDGRAQHAYAIACQKGNGIPANIGEANKYLKMAADGGYDVAQADYAANLEAAIGCPRNVAEAKRYYQMAADQGNAAAKAALEKLGGAHH
jgi:TPR repeat protein